jgi:plastocyanin
MRRRLPYLVTLLVGALLLLPITLAQGQDQSVQPVPQGQTTQPAPQDRNVQPVPIQDVASVSIGDNFFDVADIAIEPGTTVYWSNDGQVPHTVTAHDGSFDSGQLDPGASYIVTFLGSGRLSYHCQLHPEMVGSVTVGEGSGGGEPAPVGEAAPAGEAAPNEPVSYDVDTNENVLNTTV